MKHTSKLIFAMMLMTAMALVTGCKPEENPDSGNTLNGHEYVDLGLPSGTLWATCNVGAEKPEDFGNYFAWGETATKTDYNWSTYKYCNGDYTQLTKYCNNPNYGFNGYSDTLTVLQAVDDAALENWGSGWLTPTLQQWQELSQNTTTIWTTQHGVVGRLFTASNGNTLFLPAAGLKHYEDVVEYGTYGCYWSSSFYTANPTGGWSIDFTQSYVISNGIARETGRSIRPVHAVANN